MTRYGDYYQCAICGHIIGILKPGKPSLACCGQEMIRLEAKGAAEEGKEKHVPVIVPEGYNTTIKLGGIPHPMTEEHYFCFIEIVKKDGQRINAQLNPGDEPAAVFNVSVMDIDAVYAYCNIHGLWIKQTH